jgi:hypothetical protein
MIERRELVELETGEKAQKAGAEGAETTKHNRIFAPQPEAGSEDHRAMILNARIQRIKGTSADTRRQ